MHFVGDGIGFFRRVLVIVFSVGLSVRVSIGVQRFLQLFQFRWLDKRLGHGLDCFGPLLGISLRFFVFSFGELFGKRGYVFVGEVCDVRVRDLRRTCFGIKPIEVAGDFFFSVRRRSNIFRRAGECFRFHFLNGRFLFFRNRG
jgi:hypothetical protein